MSTELEQAREELKELLRDYSRVELNQKSEDEAFKEEAAYAASGLSSSDISNRLRAVEFLEILGENPYAQDYLLKAMNDKEGSVVQKAVQALGKVAQKKSIPALHEFIKKSNSKHLIAEISRIIGKIERKAT